jgi:hypothetical protein
MMGDKRFASFSTAKYDIYIYIHTSVTCANWRPLYFIYDMLYVEDSDTISCLNSQVYTYFLTILIKYTKCWIFPFICHICCYSPQQKNYAFV